jgi:gas vesicle protein
MEAMTRQSWTDDHIDERFDRVEGQISDFRIETRTELKDLRGEIKQQGAELRGEIKAQGDELRGEIKAQGDELRGEIKGLGDEMSEHHADTQEQFGRVHDDVIALHRMLSRIGWSAAFALVAATVGLLITNL